MNLLTTESVSEGHPDKVADQIAEAICDFLLQKDSQARVACEVFVNSKVIFIGGEVKSRFFKLDAKFKEDIEKLVLMVVCQHIGYTEETWGFLKGLQTKQSKIEIRLHHQSEEIDHRVGVVGAGDNSTVFGFANSDLNFFPTFQHLANLILEKINQIRKKNQLLQQQLFRFAPDGKVQILFDRVNNTVQRITLCQQFLHKLSSVEKPTIEAKIRTEVIDPIFVQLGLKPIYVLSLKDFKKGGPNADSGLTGRKLMIDNYGIFSHHGGGSFAGKDPSKTDRSLALFARFVAKHLVALNLAKEITLQISSVIGEQNPVNITPFAYDQEADLLTINRVIKKFFSWNLQKIIEQLKLRHTQFLPFGTYGYFGRLAPQSSWETINYLNQIKIWLQKNKN